MPMTADRPSYEHAAAPLPRRPRHTVVRYAPCRKQQAMIARLRSRSRTRRCCCWPPAAGPDATLAGHAGAAARRRRRRERRHRQHRRAGIGKRARQLELGAAGPRRGRARQQDLEVNVGDRVFFGLDSSVLDATGAPDASSGRRAWLQQFPDGDRDRRGPHRPARHHRVQSGAGRAPRHRGQELSGVARHRPAERVLTISYGKERLADPGQ